MPSKYGWSSGCCSVNVLGCFQNDDGYEGVHGPMIEKTTKDFIAESTKYYAPPNAKKVKERGGLVLLTSQQQKTIDMFLAAGWRILGSIPSCHNGCASFTQGTFCHILGSPGFTLAGEPLPVAKPGESL